MMDREPSQRWDADDYARHGRFVADLAAPVLDLLAPRPGEAILDLGCGDGALTARIVARGATVVGVDSSPALIAAARALGLDARLMDGRALALDRTFDAVFSNAALHWMGTPAPVLAGVARALRPGGRFVGELGGHGNAAAIRVALGAVFGARGLPVVEPWYFPTAAAFGGELERAGFTVGEIALIPRPTPLPTDLQGWLQTFAGPFVGGLAPADRQAVFDAVEALLAPVLRDDTGRWIADYVRLRFAATRR